MAENKRTRQKKKEETGPQHQLKHQHNEPDSERLPSGERSPLLIEETSGHPSAAEHAMMLSKISSVQRHEFVIQLQQIYGNRYVERLFDSVRLQTKLNVGRQDDVHEKEAGIVAKEVKRYVSHDRSKPAEEEEVQKTDDVRLTSLHSSPGLQLKQNGNGGKGESAEATQQPGEVPESAAAQQTLSPAEERALKLKIDKEVAKLPVPEIPSEEQAKRAIDEGTKLGSEMAPLVKDNPAMAAFVQAEMAPQAEKEAPPVEAQSELPGPAPVSEPGELLEEQPPQRPVPSGKTSSGLGQVGDRGGKREKGGVALEMGSHVETTVSTVGEGLQIAGQGSKSALSVLGHVFGAIGTFFSTISAFLDIKALISTGKKLGKLESVLNQARKSVQGDFPTRKEQELLDAIQYAIDQKYSKLWIRATSLVGTIAATSAGIAIWAAGGITAVALASNPVGWGIAAVILGFGITTGVLIALYKLGRAIYKWFTGTKGRIRAEMATKLFNHSVKERTHLANYARDAIRSLGLDPSQMSREYNIAEGRTKARVEENCIQLIARKLKSS